MHKAHLFLRETQVFRFTSVFAFMIILYTSTYLILSKYIKMLHTSYRHSGTATYYEQESNGFDSLQASKIIFKSLLYLALV